MEHEFIVKEKKWFKKRWPYIAAIVLLLVAGVVWSQVGGSSAPRYETAKVVRGDLIQTVDATGKAESADEIGLRFESSGKVSNVYKKVGDSVKKGEMIASLNLQFLNAEVSQASANVKKAEADLDKVLAGDTQESLDNLAAKVDQAKANLNQIKATYANSIADAEAAVDTAKNNLKLAEGGENSLIVNDAYGDMVSILNSTQNTLADALTEADNILGIDNALANDDFESELLALDTGKFNTAKTKYYAAKAAKSDADTATNPLSSASEHAAIDWAADTAEEALVTMKELLFAVAAVLDQTHPIGDLSQSELDTLKTNIQTARESVATQYTSLVNQKQSVKDALNSYDTYLVAYNKAVSNLDNTKKKADADTAAYEALVKQAEANYADAKNPPRDVDVAGYYAALSAAQASLAQSAATRNKSIIFAPADGVVGKINYKIGEYVSSQDEVIKIVSPHFEVKVDIPETDIVKISLGNTAKVTLDAFGDDAVFQATVAEVEKGETVIQDVVYYTVTLTLNDDPAHEVLNGMTANVIFNTETKKNVLYIPQRAVLSKDGVKYVRVLENGEVKEVDVKLGLRGDGGLVEILEGLSEWSEVIVKEIEKK
ncbi:MAG: efflux RND transporter periplasmic adaptor subunit [Candidatus Magasanikbacteria bacterium]|nr:efflux RND transporter periplasmic adaptor subunit [Candidatus Magasanikbacteria bacterium]